MFFHIVREVDTKGKNADLRPAFYLKECENHNEQGVGMNG